MSNWKDCQNLCKASSHQRQLDVYKQVSNDKRQNGRDNRFEEEKIQNLQGKVTNLRSKVNKRNKDYYY